MTEVWSASTVRRLAAAALEQQRFAGTAGRWLARGYQRWADPVRPLRLTPWASRGRSLATRAGRSATSGNGRASDATLFVGVGGARLGGNHKTPFVLALARALIATETAAGRVAVVVSGYGSRARHAVWVHPEQRVPDVSDEARWLAGELVPRGVRVVTAASRQAALDLAASWADCVILDGVLQTRPRALTLSVLLAAPEDLVSNHCPPAGDLRAAPARLLAASDCWLSERVRSPAATRVGELPGGAHALSYESSLRGAVGAHGALGLEELRRRRVGLVLAVARPERILASLQHYGIFPISTKFFADHDVASLRRAASAAPVSGVELWLGSGKCAAKLDDRFAGVPLYALRHELSVPDELVDEIVAHRLE